MNCHLSHWSHKSYSAYKICILPFAILFTLLFAQEPLPFKQALAPRTFSFPADHGSHAGCQTEWWYVTGNLKDANNRAFGFQFTIFRRALAPQTAAERGRKSAWAADDLFLLHLAVSDIQAQRYLSREA